MAAARACAALVLAACTCCTATPYTFDESLSLTAVAAAAATGDRGAVVVRWRFTQRADAAAAGYFPAGVAALLARARRARVTVASGGWREAAWGAAARAEAALAAAAGVDGGEGEVGSVDGHGLGLASSGLRLRLRPQPLAAGEDVDAHIDDEGAAALAAAVLSEGALGSLACGAFGAGGGGGAPGGGAGGWSGAGGVPRRWLTSRGCDGSSAAGGGSNNDDDGGDDGDSDRKGDGGEDELCVDDPSASACADGLAAFLALLPCRGARGLAGFVDPQRVLSAEWWEMDLLAEAEAPVGAVAGEGGAGGEGAATITLSQTLTAVLLLPSESGDGGGSGSGSGTLDAAPDLAALLLGPDALALVSAADPRGPGPERGRAPACPVARSSRAACFGLPACPAGASASQELVTPALPTPLLELAVERRAAALRLGVGSVLFRLAVRVSGGGGGGDGGGSGADGIGGGDSGSRLVLTVREVLPWMFARDRTSLVAWVADEGASEGGSGAGARVVPCLLRVVSAAVERGAPEVAELRVELELAPRLAQAHAASAGTGAVVSTSGVNASAASPLDRSIELLVSYRFSTTLLHAQEYPAAVHRGFEIPAALVAARWLGPRASPRTRARARVLAAAAHARAEPLVVELAAPDQSMPFNVATLVSTALAFTLGSLINAAARRPRGAGAAA